MPRICGTYWNLRGKIILDIDEVMEKKRAQSLDFKSVVQKHPMGCAIACVAARCGLSYQKAISFFENKNHAWTRGYYCPEVVMALANAGYKYKYQLFDFERHFVELETPGTIAFTKPDQQYPAGHFFLKSRRWWMNPWSNYPLITPAKASFQSELQGKVSYIIYEHY